MTALAGGSSVVDTVGTGAYTRADVIALQEAVPPRFRGRAAFLSSLELLNHTREFPRLEGGVDHALVDDTTTPPRVRGWSWHEHSEMASTVAGGNPSPWQVTSRLAT